MAGPLQRSTSAHPGSSSCSSKSGEAGLQPIFRPAGTQSQQRRQLLQLRCCWLPATRRSLQEEDAALAIKVPLPINRLCRVRQWLSEKVAALNAELAALEGKQMVRPAARAVAASPITCATHAHSCCPAKQQWGAAKDRSQHLPWVVCRRS